ncbi:MarR family winged helix-turn-helix transcriptional regulator [Marisediminicola antarctica]|uniref:Transcriptional regulator n=1 Tax=Marisediminicola antarctica TaxID=674079 RepID=A0A7L5AEY9_9MICO|nr:MarR family transcriptional regulator [Marisediminicola antarctica]QHO68426.1 transcriptional regulator [Marisediminicola antarctica]
MSDKRVAVSAWESLFRAQVSVMRHLNAEFPTNELSLNEYDVLFNLSQHPGWKLRIKELNKYLLLTQPSVSRLIDRLAARALVTKSSDPSDARGIIVEMTQAGFDLFRRVAVTHMKSIADRVGAALTDEELRELQALTDKLRRIEQQ